VYNFVIYMTYRTVLRIINLPEMYMTHFKTQCKGNIRWKVTKLPSNFDTCQL